MTEPCRVHYTILNITPQITKERKFVIPYHITAIQYKILPLRHFLLLKYSMLITDPVPKFKALQSLKPRNRKKQKKSYTLP